jgi:hypothetical protein
MVVASQLKEPNGANREKDVAVVGVKQARTNRMSETGARLRCTRRVHEFLLTKTVFEADSNTAVPVCNLQRYNTGSSILFFI